MPLQRKDILDIESLSVQEIELILDTADGMKEISERPIKKVPTLRGKTVILFFYEPSTRTRMSFDLAAKRLSADSLSFSANVSSLVKGETLLDTSAHPWRPCIPTWWCCATPIPVPPSSWPAASRHR